MRRSADRAGLGVGHILGSSSPRACRHHRGLPLVRTLRVERLGVAAEAVLGRDLRGGGDAGHGERGHCVVSSRRVYRARTCEEKWPRDVDNFPPVSQLQLAPQIRFFWARSMVCLRVQTE